MSSSDLEGLNGHELLDDVEVVLVAEEAPDDGYVLDDDDERYGA